MLAWVPRIPEFLARSDRRSPGFSAAITDKRTHTVKKLIFLAVLALGLAAVWQKVRSDRAEMDLWTEATTADE